MKRKKLKKSLSTSSAVIHYGADVLYSNEYLKCNEFIQHGSTTVYEHTLSVAMLSVAIARRLPFKFDFYSLVRGCLLHDFFLYDWHDEHKPIKNHALNHASRALENAAERFAINPIEADMIKKHMFPLNIPLPKYRETFILTISDKICSVRETFSHPMFEDRIKSEAFDQNH